ncbi:MAG: glutathione peroxidase [Sphingobacterium hotanense]
MLVKMILLYTMLFQQPSLYDYSFNTIDGKKVSLADFKGKELLIVNTASKCGFTKQYKELQELHKQYGDKLVVIGFPSDNFGGQEFDANEKIQEFCEQNYGVTFLISEKVDVKGEKAHPLFKYLTSAQNEDFTGDIKWNFEKFLINKDGQLTNRYRSKVTPLDESIVSKI